MNKYGEVEGKKRFFELSNKAYSDVSQNMFMTIDEKLPSDISKKSKFAVKNTEEQIELYFDDGRCSICRPDYILGKKIIEFYGDYWHANPEFYKAEEIINYPG